MEIYETPEVLFTFGKCLMFNDYFKTDLLVFEKLFQMKEFPKILKLPFYVGICKRKLGEECFADFQKRFSLPDEKLNILLAQLIL